MYFNQLSGYIIDTQVSSVLITFGLITALFALLIGPAYAVAAVVASAASLSAVLGVVALAGLPFDFAMVLVASVGIGMNVDHAVHLTAHFKHARASGVVPSMAASHALASVGPPALASVTLFAAGFAVFLASKFVLLQRFGLFNLVGAVFAILIVLLALPVLLRVLARYGSRWSRFSRQGSYRGG